LIDRTRAFNRPDASVGPEHEGHDAAARSEIVDENRGVSAPRLRDLATPVVPADGSAAGALRRLPDRRRRVEMRVNRHQLVIVVLVGMLIVRWTERVAGVVRARPEIR